MCHTHTQENPGARQPTAAQHNTPRTAQGIQYNRLTPHVPKKVALPAHCLSKQPDTRLGRRNSVTLTFHMSVHPHLPSRIYPFFCTHSLTHVQPTTIPRAHTCPKSPNPIISALASTEGESGINNTQKPRQTIPTLSLNTKQPKSGKGKSQSGNPSRCKSNHHQSRPTDHFS